VRFKVKVFASSSFKYLPVTIKNTAYAWDKTGLKIDDKVEIRIRETVSQNSSTYSYASANNNTSQTTDQSQEDNNSSNSGEVLGAQSADGEIKGAEDVKAGANLLALIILMFVSLLIAFMLYCKIREKKLLQDLVDNRGNKLYKFLIKSYFKLKTDLKLRVLRI